MNNDNIDLSPIIGIIILILALLGPALKKWLTKKDREKNPEKYRQEQKSSEDSFKEFLRSLDVQEEELPPEEAPPPPPPAPIYRTPQVAIKEIRRAIGETKAFHTGMDVYQQKTEFDAYALPIHIQEDIGDHLVSSELRDEHVQAAYALKKEDLVARGRHVLEKAASPKEWIIIQEILSPPKGLR